MCAVLLPPGANPIAVDKYIKYQIKGIEGRVVTGFTYLRITTFGGLW
jgi:hypothetical protein